MNTFTSHCVNMSKTLVCVDETVRDENLGMLSIFDLKLFELIVSEKTFNKCASEKKFLVLSDNRAIFLSLKYVQEQVEYGRSQSNFNEFE